MSNKIPNVPLSDRLVKDTDETVNEEIDTTEVKETVVDMASSGLSKLSKLRKKLAMGRIGRVKVGL